MKIKLIKPWNFNAPGEVLDLDPPVATLVIQRGVAVALEENVEEHTRKRGRPPKAREMVVNRP